MKVFLVVEGDSDKRLLDGQKSWFHTFGIELGIRITNGKPNMINKALKHYQTVIYSNADKVVFLPDQNNDQCALVTREKVGMNAQEKAVTIVMKRKLEAWILADGQCIRNATNLQYSYGGQTDRLVNPKQKLRSFLKRKLGYLPSTIEAVNLVAPHFSIVRAALKNSSARRFKEHIESFSGSSATGIRTPV